MDSDDDNVDEVLEGNVIILMYKMLVKAICFGHVYSQGNF